MKVDIIHVPGTAADFQVCPRQNRNAYDGERYNDAPPIFGPASDCDCMEFCETNGHAFRHCKFAALVQPQFFADLEKRCNKVHAEMIEAAKACGWSFSSDCIYKASAAWKDCPTHYAYFGDFGSVAKFAGITDETANSENGTTARLFLQWLNGIAAAVWELGFNLTFDKDGQHRIFNTSAQWVALEEEEY